MSLIKALKRHLKPAKWSVGQRKLHGKYKTKSHAKAVAKESNYIAREGIGLGKPKHKWKYEAVGRKVYVSYQGKLKKVI